MRNTNPDAETIRSVLTFLGGALAFSAVVIGIINAKLQKAKTAAAKERVISRTFGIAGACSPMIGIILCWGFGIETALVWFFCLGTVFVSLGYLYTAGPPRRVETLVLVVSWCGAALMITLHLISLGLGFIERIFDVLRK
jgi:hypothetical protein